MRLSPTKLTLTLTLTCATGCRPLAAPASPSDTSFSNATVYVPAHRALSPDQLLALVGPSASIEWARLAPSGLGCVDGRHARPGLYAYGGDLGEFEPGDMAAEFDAFVFDASSPVGVPLGPVRTPFGYHVVIIDERTM